MQQGKTCFGNTNYVMLMYITRVYKLYSMQAKGIYQTYIKQSYLQQQA